MAGVDANYSDPVRVLDELMFGGIQQAKPDELAAVFQPLHPGCMDEAMATDNYELFVINHPALIEPSVQGGILKKADYIQYIKSLEQRTGANLSNRCPDGSRNLSGHLVSRGEPAPEKPLNTLNLDEASERWNDLNENCQDQSVTPLEIKELGEAWTKKFGEPFDLNLENCYERRTVWTADDKIKLARINYRYCPETADTINPTSIKDMFVSDHDVNDLLITFRKVELTCGIVIEWEEGP